MIVYETQYLQVEQMVRENIWRSENTKNNNINYKFLKPSQ